MLSSEEFKEIQKQKMTGYLLRFGAVAIWGLEPLLLKYSPAGNMDTDIRIFYVVLGATIFSISSLIFLKLIKNKKHWNPRLPVNKYFIGIIIFEIIIVYLINLSINTTSSTNFIIIDNFGPVFALILAIIFWKKEIIYFQSRKNIKLIFLAFFLGSAGSSLLFYNDIINGNDSYIDGNFFAIARIIFEVLFITSQIRYAKYLKDYQSYFLNFYTWVTLLLMMSIYIILFKSHIFFITTVSELFWAVFTGALIGLGIIFNYESFRRMDGFIAYLMFNISIIITFFIEAFILKEIIVTYYLVFSGLLITSASIFAEIVNTKCEKERIEKKHANK